MRACGCRCGSVETPPSTCGCCLRRWRSGHCTQNDQRQVGQALDQLIRAELGPYDRQLLDSACGIGTQAIGLARQGHHVVGSDLSPAAARRAAVEAAARDLSIRTVAADMRHLPFASSAFDIVVCADNSIAHLLTLVELAAALREMKRVLRPGGLLMIGTRSDFARETPPHHQPATGPPHPRTPSDHVPALGLAPRRPAL